MGLSLVTGPALDPVSLAEAKAHCRATSTDEDGLIAGYILAARQHIETVCNRALITQTLDLFIDRDWPYFFDFEWRCNRRLIELPRAPAQSVTSISYVDSAGASQTLATNQYAVDVSTPIGRIEPSYDVVWPTVRNQAKAITVRFVAGYGSSPGSIPEPIRQAMLLLIGHWYEQRETVNVGNITGELPFATSALLSPYRVFY
jgi:uncharacterized phiE125 gp8 family phage protein